MPHPVRYAIRRLAADRTLTSTAFLIIAFGIGASTALFSIFNAVLLAPLPYPAASRLVAARLFEPQSPGRYASFPANAAHVDTWQRQCRGCEDLIAIDSMRATISGSSGAEQVDGLEVSANFFSFLGIAPYIGRGFTAADSAPGAAAVVVISHDLWLRRFGGDRGIAGRAVDVNGRPAIVVGVAPARVPLPGPAQLGDLVRLPRQAAIFRPLIFSPDDLRSPGDLDYGVVVRLRDGVTPAAVTAEFDALEPAVAARTGDDGRKRAVIEPLQQIVARQARGPLLMLLAATLALLLIVCLNLANILMARHAGRRRDTAIRVALGARRPELVRQILFESLLLCGGGGLAGLLLVPLLLRAIAAQAPPTLPSLNPFTIDFRVLAFATLASLAAGLLVGALPALRLSGLDPGDMLRAVSYTTTDAARSGGARRVLVALQAAIGTLLLVASGLLLASFVGLQRVDKGFDTAGILTIDVALPPGAYRNSDDEERTLERMRAQLAGLPGVTAAAIASRVPLRGEAVVNLLSYEHDNRPASARPVANYRYVTPEYFRAIGTPLLRGRTFRESDRGRAVVVLSASAARALWPEGNPVGRTVKTGGFLGAPSEVIGIAADSRAVDLARNDVLFAYLPYWLRPQTDASFVVRADVPPGTLTAAARRRILDVERGTAIPRVATMDEIVAEAIVDRRFELTLMLLFGAAAALLASLGVYAIVAAAVARRQREMGIRIALGASAADIHRLVLREGIAPVGAGLAAGLTGSLWLGRVLSGLLFGVHAGDPRVMAAAAALVIAATLAACAGPARRAAASSCRFAD